MPRTLPWLNGNSSSSIASRASPQRTTKRRRVDDELKTTGPQQARLKFERDGGTEGRTRPSSSSPPPSQPLPQEYMREGLSADDEWMMVEDEFLATAQQYTRHLHRAEYQRQQKLARSRVQEPNNSLHNILNGGAIKQHTDLEMGANKEKAAANFGVKVEEENGPDPWKNDVRLAGLMDGQTQHRRLVTTARPPQARSKTSCKIPQREEEGPGSSPPELLDTPSSPLDKEQRYTSSNHTRADQASAVRGNKSGLSRVDQPAKGDSASYRAASTTVKGNISTLPRKPVRDIDPFVVAGSSRQRIESRATMRPADEDTVKSQSRAAIDWDALDKPLLPVDDRTRRSPHKQKSKKPTATVVSLDEIPTFLV